MSTPTTTTPSMLDLVTKAGKQKLTATVTDARQGLLDSVSKLQSLLKSGKVPAKTAVALTELIDELVDEDSRAAAQARLANGSPSSIEPADALRVVLDTLSPARKNYVARGIVPEHPGYIKDNELGSDGLPKELAELRQKNDELTAQATAITNGDAPVGMVKISDVKPLITKAAKAVNDMQKKEIRAGDGVIKPKQSVMTLAEDDYDELRTEAILPLLAKVGVTPTE